MASLPANHYRLSSQSYGGFSFDSIGRATSQGASTADPDYAPLNGPPSAVFLPHGSGKTVGQNGRTLALPGQYTFGQSRTNSQKIQWVPARETSLAYGATAAGTSLAYKAKAVTWDLSELFRQFDTDNDGYLTITELKRAFRAIGLKKRAGHKAQMDLAMFKSFDTNGDGKITPEEFDANLPPDVRAKIEEKLNGGFVFDKKQWEASAARHGHWDMRKVFKQFDSDGSGFLSMGELKRAFRAIGLEKRKGGKLDLDEQMFRNFDTDGNGKIDVTEFEANMPDDVREKLEEKLNGGWEFDPQLWAESQARHSKWNMAKVFAQFDTDGDGYLSIDELKRAFHAIGLKKRSGRKGRMDDQMFKSFDTDGDGKISPQEFEDNLLPDTRAVIEECLEKGFEFDPKLWGKR